MCSYALAESRIRSFWDGSSPGSTSYYSVARARTDSGFNSFSRDQTTQDDAQSKLNAAKGVVRLTGVVINVVWLQLHRVDMWAALGAICTVHFNSWDVCPRPSICLDKEMSRRV